MESLQDHVSHHAFFRGQGKDHFQDDGDEKIPLIRYSGEGYFVAKLRYGQNRIGYSKSHGSEAKLFMLCPLYVIRFDEMASHSLSGALPTGNDHLSKRTFYRSRFWPDFHIALKGLGLGLWYKSTMKD